MPSKDFELQDIGRVVITKRATSRHIRISLAADGTVQVSLPRWTPYQAGLQFAAAQRDWIIQHRPATPDVLRSGDRIGKSHQLFFKTGDTLSTRLRGNLIIINRPAGLATDHPAVQAAAHKAAIRALRQQATSLLPGRTAALAEQFGFTYGNVGIKQLKGRWGSCDSHQNIIFNLYLLQLAWPLIDYVILHELVHTKHLDHGPGFWQEFERCEPRAKHFRKLIKLQRPELKIDRLVP